MYVYIDYRVATICYTKQLLVPSHFSLRLKISSSREFLGKINEFCLRCFEALEVFEYLHFRPVSSLFQLAATRRNSDSKLPLNCNGGLPDKSLHTDITGTQHSKSINVNLINRVTFAAVRSHKCTRRLL